MCDVARGECRAEVADRRFQFGEHHFERADTPVDLLFGELKLGLVALAQALARAGRGLGIGVAGAAALFLQPGLRGGVAGGVVDAGGDVLEPRTRHLHRGYDVGGREFGVLGNEGFSGDDLPIEAEPEPDRDQLEQDVNREQHAEHDPARPREQRVQHIEDHQHQQRDRSADRDHHEGVEFGRVVRLDDLEHSPERRYPGNEGEADNKHPPFGVLPPPRQLRPPGICRVLRCRHHRCIFSRSPVC